MNATTLPKVLMSNRDRAGSASGGAALSVNSQRGNQGRELGRDSLARGELALGVHRGLLHRAADDRYRDLSRLVAQKVSAIQHPMSEPAKPPERMSRERQVEDRQIL